MRSPHVHVEQTNGLSPGRNRIEIVERKGLGHPDTICDSVMERVSQALSRAYIEKFGRILHHNCDKGLLIAGQVEHRLGGGRVIKPMRLVIGDRATLVPEFDVGALAAETAREWFRENLPEVDPNQHIVFDVALKGGSAELTEIFREPALVAAANDTSAAVGYAPLTETEQVVLAAEKFLNGREFKTKFPASGQDIKVMGVRKGRHLDLTIAMPLLDRFIQSEASYFHQLDEAREVLLSYLRSRLHALDEIMVGFNHLDRRGIGLPGMYLSILGTSAEDADSGEVGRGNQVNGIIALNRPRGSEAAAGKNSVSHVGKIYSVLTHVIAEKIYREIPGLDHVLVWLCSRIGAPVNDPRAAAIQVEMRQGATCTDVADAIHEIVERELAGMPEFCNDLASGKYLVC